jgi:hypothetical protein
MPTKSRCAKATGLLNTLDLMVVWCDLFAGNGVRFVHLNNFLLFRVISFFYIANKDLEIKEVGWPDILRNGR